MSFYMSMFSRILGAGLLGLATFCIQAITIVNYTDSEKLVELGVYLPQMQMQNVPGEASRYHEVIFKKKIPAKGVAQTMPIAVAKIAVEVSWGKKVVYDTEEMIRVIEQDPEKVKEWKVVGGPDKKERSSKGKFIEYRPVVHENRKNDSNARWYRQMTVSKKSRIFDEQGIYRVVDAVVERKIVQLIPPEKVAAFARNRVKLIEPQEAVLLALKNYKAIDVPKPKKIGAQHFILLSDSEYKTSDSGVKESYKGLDIELFYAPHHAFDTLSANGELYKKESLPETGAVDTIRPPSPVSITDLVSEARALSREQL